MLKIALTGNIASGKTFVENFLKTKGYETFCLDEVTHEIYEYDNNFQETLLKTFGTCERKEIAKIVFKDNKKLKILESLIHPIIEGKLQKYFGLNSGKKFVIVVIPLLFETGFDKYFDKIIFVSSNENIRMKRLMERNNLSEADARKRILSQDDEVNKIIRSDYIIRNNGTIEELTSQCERLTEELNTLL